VSGYLITSIAANAKPLPPAAELGWWYQYYFATERGRAGYDANRTAFAKVSGTTSLRKPRRLSRKQSWTSMGGRLRDAA
jgi:hypothetical protein